MAPPKIEVRANGPAAHVEAQGKLIRDAELPDLVTQADQAEVTAASLQLKGRLALLVGQAEARRGSRAAARPSARSVGGKRPGVEIDAHTPEVNQDLCAIDALRPVHGQRLHSPGGGSWGRSPQASQKSVPSTTAGPSTMP